MCSSKAKGKNIALHKSTTGGLGKVSLVLDLTSSIHEY